MNEKSMAGLYAWLFAIGLVNGIGILERLKHSHREVYVQMGSPDFGQSNLSKPMLKFQAFIFTFEFIKLRDLLLTALCLFELATQGFLVYLIIL